MLRGGDSGPVVVTGKPDESLLIEVIGHRGDIKMPPKEKLADDAIADIRRWIEIGAPWPTEVDAEKPIASGFQITDEQRNFWSLQQIRHVSAPAVQREAWPTGTLDRFVLSQIEAAGLAPSPEADRRTLIRRATFDLMGLPPTAEEIDAFVADDRPDAWERLVDRLLMSPHYGERWARFWLDVARYAEDQAHTFQARTYPNGYRYRDWVVRSLNNDLPYDRFVIEQIAGDLLEGTPEERQEREAALGYFALGPVYYADAGCAFKASLDELDDRIDTLARGFLGLTVACARCHDHKFDPISQRDYYALGGIFRSTEYREKPLVPPAVVEKFEEGQKQIREREKSIREFLVEAAASQSADEARRVTKYVLAAWRLEFPNPGLPEVRRKELIGQLGLRGFLLERWQKLLREDAAGRPADLAALRELALTPATLTPGPEADDVPVQVVAAARALEDAVTAALAARDEADEKYRVLRDAVAPEERKKISRPALPSPHAELLNALVGQQGLCRINDDQSEKSLNEPGKQKLAELKSQAEKAKSEAPSKYPFAHSLAEGNSANMPLYIRGNPNRAGEEVPRRFLSILSSDVPEPFTDGSGRLQLARAIASPQNPLTARVIVNRIWQQHFGRGIVATPSNFGALGERPTHPDLLDYLARRLIDSGWSLKSLHREILLSATYRQASLDTAAGREIDPDNRLLWRMNRRRIDVEAWRDALLSAAGNLDLTIGGPPGNLADAGFRRRTLYGTISRNSLDHMLRLFDFPDPNITSERRTSTTVPLQQLFVLNSDFMAKQAQALSARLAKDSSDDRTRINQAYRLLYGRLPTESEIAIGLEFLTAPEPAASEGTAAPKSALSRWDQYSQVLLGSNEFTFID